MASQRVVLCAFLCTIGFVYQASEICWVYFRYPSSFSVSLTKSRDLQVPSFLVCFLHTITDRRFTPWEADLEMAPMVHLGCRIVILNSDMNDYSGNLNCTHLGKFDRYVISNYWCLNYFPGDTLYTRRSLATNDRIFTVSLENYTGLAVFTTHQNGRHLDAKLHSFRMTTDLMTYHFHVVRVTRLSAPYGSRCLDYRAIGMTSGDHCLDQCRTALSIEKYNEWPPRVAALNSVNLTMSESSSILDVTECEEKCPWTDCHQVQHGGDISNGGQLDHVSFRVVASSEFDTESTEVARYQFIELKISEKRFQDHMTFLKMKSKTIGLLFALCFVGFTYQTYEICSVYFGYPSSYSVSLTKSRDVQVPSFTLCVAHHMATSKFTVSEINSKMAPAASFACRIVISTRSTGQLVDRECSYFGQYEYYVVNAHWCVNFEVNEAVWTRRSLATKVRIFAIDLANNTDLAFFTTHHNGRHVSTRMSYLGLRTALRRYSFRVASVRRLPAPYPGNCFEYETHGAVSADHCIDQCTASLSVREHGKWPRFVAASGDVNLTISETSSNDYVVQCEDECTLNDCFQRQHSIVSAYNGKQNGVHFVITASHEFDSESTEMAKFQFIELVCYVASLVTLVIPLATHQDHICPSRVCQCFGDKEEVVHNGTHSNLEHYGLYMCQRRSVLDAQLCPNMLSRILPLTKHTYTIERVKFGVALDQVCQLHKDIPGPLLILILKLNKEAPFKKDVFRAPGHQANMKALIYFLQTGRLVNIDKFSVHTIASVLKKFLRKLPGGIFGSEIEKRLFEVVQWDCPLEEKREEMHRLITSLPAVNQQLLVLLFGTFRSITTSSETSGMTSEALGVSVAPSFFQSCVTDGVHMSKLEDAQKFKAHIILATSIIKFLIDNFGVSNLFGRLNYEYYARISGRVLKVEDNWILALKYPWDSVLAPSIYQNANVVVCPAAQAGGATSSALAGGGCIYVKSDLHNVLGTEKYERLSMSLEDSVFKAAGLSNRLSIPTRSSESLPSGGQPAVLGYIVSPVGDHGGPSKVRLGDDDDDIIDLDQLRNVNRYAESTKTLTFLPMVHEKQTQRMKTRSDWFLEPTKETDPLMSECREIDGSPQTACGLTRTCSARERRSIVRRTSSKKKNKENGNGGSKPEVSSSPCEGPSNIGHATISPTSSTVLSEPSTSSPSYKPRI
ncbi:Rho GTPase-activating protein 20 [Halotydeus destructor]|nr:Rho GTPase-activating protein 20 [Halotydeus destructor]